MRGAPTAAQRYLDVVTAELAAETGRPEDRYSLARILYKCLRDHPHDIRQIYGESGERDTNEALLRRSVSAALALQGAGLATGDTALVISRNTPELSALYFGAIFCGVVLLPLHVGITAFELKHFLNISEARMIIAEKDCLSAVEQVTESDVNVEIVLFGPIQDNDRRHRSFTEVIYGLEDPVKNFWPVETREDDAVLAFSTSGSTGLPKTALLNNKGLIAQIPNIWIYHDKFPSPTAVYLCTSSPSWVTHTIAMISSLVYRVTILTTAEILNGNHLRNLIIKYKPTFALLPEYLGAALVRSPSRQPDDLLSLDILAMTGSAIPVHLLENLQCMLKPEARAISIYGITEMQGVVTYPAPGMPRASIGAVVNTMTFKIIDDEGNLLGPNQPGELCLKSKCCLFKGYIKNSKAFEELFTADGFLKTGDKVYVNEKEEVFYVDRIKFLIKYHSHHISPSEVEEVITKVTGVEAVAVCGAERGPAAMVVPRPGCKLTPQDIHDAVSSSLSDVKRLRGGVVFVESIPLVVNGKVNRNMVKTMFQDTKEDQIYYDTCSC